MAQYSTQTYTTQPQQSSMSNITPVMSNPKLKTETQQSQTFLQQATQPIRTITQPLRQTTPTISTVTKPVTQPTFQAAKDVATTPKAFYTGFGQGITTQRQETYDQSSKTFIPQYSKETKRLSQGTPTEQIQATGIKVGTAYREGYKTLQPGFEGALATVGGPVDVGAELVLTGAARAGSKVLPQVVERFPTLASKVPGLTEKYGSKIGNKFDDILKAGKEIKYVDKTSDVLNPLGKTILTETAEKTPYYRQATTLTTDNLGVAGSLSNIGKLSKNIVLTTAKEKTVAAIPSSANLFKPLTRGQRIAANVALYPLESYALAEGAGKLSVSKKYEQDPNYISTYARSQQQLLSDKTQAGAFLESTPGLNLLTGSKEQFLNIMEKDLREQGIYNDYEIKSMLQEAGKQFVRTKPLEFGAAAIPSARIEGIGRDVFAGTYGTLAAKGFINPQAGVKAIALKAFTKTAPLGIAEGLSQDYLSQRLQTGGFTGVKPMDFSQFLKPTAEGRELTIPEASTVYSEALAKGSKGTKTTLSDKEGKSVEVTQYRIDKNGQLNYAYVDKAGNVVAGKTQKDVSREYDPARGALSGAVGGLSAGIVQSTIMRRQIKDVDTLLGKEKFTARDYSPIGQPKARDIGEIKFGVSAKPGAEIPGMQTKVIKGPRTVGAPSTWFQRAAYFTDPTEWPGDVIQTQKRSFATKYLGKSYEEPVLTWRGKALPSGPKVSTLNFGIGTKTQQQVQVKAQQQSQTATQQSAFTPVEQQVFQPVSTPTDVATNIKSQTQTQIQSEVTPTTKTQTETTVGTYVNTPLRGIGWPGAGALPFGNKGPGTGTGSSSVGASENYLRNFFFEKFKSDSTSPLMDMTSKSKVKFSTDMIPSRVKSETKHPKAIEGITNRIVSNSTPFDVKSKVRRVKSWM